MCEENVQLSPRRVECFKAAAFCCILVIPAAVSEANPRVFAGSVFPGQCLLTEMSE